MSAGIDDYEDLLNLFAKVLINGTNILLKRGLYSSYVENKIEYRGIKGKFNISESIKRNSIANGIAVCEVDEFSPNLLINQIIKATVYRLLRSQSIDKELKTSLKHIYLKFQNIKLTKLKARDFKQIRLNNNNYHYHFLLKICELIYHNLSLNETTGKYEFQDFLRDRKMAYLFEAFLTNFYKKHSSFKTVKRENIHWNAIPVESTLVSLPLMQTDISLINEDRKIIMDAKYYNEALSTNYNKETIRSGHLYQIFAYLKNEISSPHYVTEGILIYPTVKRELEECYIIDGHRVTIASINLHQEWLAIEEDLLQIIE